MVTKLTTLTTSMVWEILSGILSPLFTLPNGTHYSLIRSLTHLGEKFRPSSLLGSLLPTVTPQRTFQNLLWSQLTKLLPFPLYQLNPRRRLTSSLNTSNRRNLQLSIAKGLSISKEINLMLRLPNQRSIHLKS